MPSKKRLILNETSNQAAQTLRDWLAVRKLCALPVFGGGNGFGIGVAPLQGNARYRCCCPRSA